MNVLIIGSGGREHALAWKVAQSPRVAKVFVAPGNAGTARESELTNVAITAIPELVAFAASESVGLTIVGPEGPLAAGVVDAFRAAGLPIFGPAQAAAQLESSKDYAKAFMARHGIPTAQSGRYATSSVPSADLTGVAILSVPTDGTGVASCAVWDLTNQRKLAEVEWRFAEVASSLASTDFRS